VFYYRGDLLEASQQVSCLTSGERKNRQAASRAKEEKNGGK
jgi:hypothetical protein